MNVAGDDGGDLNGYQRLLVHQLVQQEFPGYRSFARNRQSFVQIEKADPKREENVRSYLRISFDILDCRQTEVVFRSYGTTFD